MGKTKFWYVWRSMISRCNPKYKDSLRYAIYAGKGIKVCERWKKFNNFADDMYESYVEHLYDHPRTTLDRINRNGDYCLDNCRWATDAEQRRNSSQVRLVTLNGETLCLKDWAYKLGIKPGSLYFRIYNLKWSLEKAITTPIRTSGRSG